MILSLRINSENDLPSAHILQQYAYILIDAPPTTHDKKYGGTGRFANWTIAKNLTKNYKLILAGGLRTDNVKEAINFVCPFAVDVASGIESSQGIKNHALIKKFIEESNNE